MSVKRGLSLSLTHTLKKEHTLRVLWNRVLRRKFGPKREEVVGHWRKLHNENFITCTL
jgi:hypothetical protein